MKTDVKKTKQNKKKTGNGKLQKPRNVNNDIHWAKLITRLSCCVTEPLLRPSPKTRWMHKWYNKLGETGDGLWGPANSDSTDIQIYKKEIGDKNSGRSLAFDGTPYCLID